MTHHTAAVRLYKKMGFIIEGTKKHALKVKDNMLMNMSCPN